MVKFAAASWSFVLGEYAGRAQTVEETAREVHALGYDGLALGGFEPQANPERYPTRAARREMVRTVADLGLALVSYAPDLREYDFYDGRPESRSRYRDAFSRAVDFCSDCGIPLIRVDTVTLTPYPRDFDYERGWEATIDIFARDAEEAAARNIVVGWEFEPGRLFNAPLEILGILSEVGRPNFKIQYDTAHGQMCAVVGANQYRGNEHWPGGQPGFIHALSDAIADVHFADNDNTLRAEGNSNKLTVGAGAVDFSSVIRALRNGSGASEWWTVDLGPQAEQTVERYSASLSELKRLAGG